MPDIVVNDFSHVTIDGVHAGALVDVLANYPGLSRADLHAAVGRWSLGREQAHAAELKAAEDRHAGLLEQHRAKADEQLKAQAAAHAEAQARREQEHEQYHSKRHHQLSEQARHHEARAAELQAQVDALGGTELGRMLAAEAKKARLREAMARHAAELAALDAEHPDA